MKMAENFTFSWESARREMETLEQAAFGRIAIKEWGKTADDRSILELMAGPPDAPCHFLIQGGIHGREYMNTPLLLRLLWDYLKKGIQEEYCIHLIPMANPDGCTICQEGMNGIRDPLLRQGVEEIWKREGPREKDYFSRWKANARGVDPNRNFKAGWENNRIAFPSASGYPGSEPESEAETKALVSIGDEYPIAACISYHSSGSLIYWDYGCQGRLYQQEMALAKELGEATGYPLVSTVEERAAPAGCSDYFVQKLGIPAVTIETGRSCCPLGKWEYERIYKENKKIWEALFRFPYHQSGR